MQAGDVYLGQVFANDQQNVIPRFQRPYVWKEAENWAPLWQDIRQAAEDVEAESQQDCETAEPRTYFLGAVVLQQRKKFPKRISSWNVIDGQQRLTTLQILFAAARAIADEIGASNASSKFTSLIENRQEVVHIDFPDDRYKVWPLPQDREPFLWAVRRTAEQLPLHNIEHRIVKARRWFEDAIREWVTDAPDRVDRLEFLHDTIKERMQLVQITLEPGDDPQVIFEVLNHRGVPLDAADLVKNLLFQALDARGAQSKADELLMNSWLPLDASPWRDEVTSGRIRRKSIDLLLSYWLTVRTGSEVVVEHLFADFKRWLQESGEDAEEVIKNIRRFADTMEAIRALPETHPTAQLVDRMEATQTTTPWPLLLYLHSNPFIPLPERHRAASAIDSFLMRRAICRLTTKDYNRLFLQILAAAKAAEPHDAGKAVESLLLAQTADSRVWPTDAQFFSSLVEINAFTVLIRARLKALLVGIENLLRTGKTEPGSLLKSADPRLNIEHLLPQAWEKTWPLSVGPSDPEYERQLQGRMDAIHKLGNLTLTTTKLNPALSNKAWKYKRKEIQRHSLLRITTGSVLTSPVPYTDLDDETWSSEWNEDRIHRRTQWLAEQAMKAWSRPDTDIKALLH